MDLKLPPEILKRLEQLQIHLRRAVLGQRQGGHKSLKKGHGLEFSEYKPYSPGDDFRSIDWNVLARTDKIYTRVYREEQDVKVLVILDYSKSLHFTTLPRQIALALSYVTLGSGDKVSLLLPGVSQTPWSSSPSSYYNMVKTLQTEKPLENSKKNADLKTDFLKQIGRATSQMKLPGKVFLISDMHFPLNDFLSALEYLYVKNFEVNIIEIETIEEFRKLNSNTLLDSETGESLDVILDENDFNRLRQLYLNHQKEISRACKKYNFAHSVIPVRTPLEIALFDYALREKIFS